VPENIYKTGNICRFWAAARIAAAFKKKKNSLSYGG